MKEAEIRSAWNKSLRFLGYRQRSEKEIVFYLKKKGFAHEVINDVIALLKERNFINDRQFALEWISCSHRKGKGIARVVMELKGKGISDSIINESKGIVFSEEEELERAVSVMEKYLPSEYQRDDEKLLRRSAAFLKRRGFSIEIVYKTVNAFFSEKENF